MSSHDDEARWNALVDFARTERRATSEPPLDAATAERIAERALVRIGPIRPSRARPWPKGLRHPAFALVAAVAALLAWRAWPSHGPALPAYTLHVHASELPYRSGAVALDQRSAREVALSRGSELRIALVPNEPHATRVEVAIEAHGPEGEHQHLRPHSERSADGALWVRAIVGSELPLGPGRWRTTWRVHGEGGQAPPLELTVVVLP